VTAITPPMPLALLRPSTTYTPHSAAAVVGISESTIRNQLRAAPLDGRRRVTEGPWAGAYRRGTHWRIPADVVRRMVGSNGPLRREVETELRQALAENTAAINRLRMAIAAAFERFAEVVNGGAS
jgi:predicted transcriptional regulator